MSSLGISVGPPSSRNAVERDRERGRQRLARIRQATPKWLSAEQHAEIKAFYTEAQRLSKVSGRIHHVDHIIPIWGENVRGLHVPWKLRVITAKANLHKTNQVRLVA